MSTGEALAVLLVMPFVVALAMWGGIKVMRRVWASDARTKKLAKQ